MTIVTLAHLAKGIRSKNAGAYRLTIDVMFADPDLYRAVRDFGALSPEMVAKAYGLAMDDVTEFVWFEPALALKVTIRRPIPSGSLGDGDVYGAQQHVPMMNIQLPEGFITQHP